HLDGQERRLRPGLAEATETCLTTIDLPHQVWRVQVGGIQRKIAVTAATHTSIQVHSIRCSDGRITGTAPRRPAAIQSIQLAGIASTEPRATDGKLIRTTDQLVRHEGKLLFTGLATDGMQHAAV